MNSITKICSKCKHEKPLDCFYTHKGCKDGYVNTCKECYSIHLKRDREARRDFYKVKQKENYNKHKEKRKVYYTKYSKEHKKERAEYTKIWRNTDKENKLKKKRDYHKNNIDKIREYRKNNKDKISARVKLYYHTRRANGGSFTKKQWNKLIEFYGNKCLRCESLNVELTIDHVVPVSLGGRNSIDNIQPLCKSCNSSKNNKTFDYRFDKGKFAKELNDE